MRLGDGRCGFVAIGRQPAFPHPFRRITLGRVVGANGAFAGQAAQYGIDQALIGALSAGLCGGNRGGDHRMRGGIQKDELEKMIDYYIELDEVEYYLRCSELNVILNYMYPKL